jgi:hypothetical protein
MEHDDRYDSDLYDVPPAPIFLCDCCGESFISDARPADGLCSSCAREQAWDFAEAEAEARCPRYDDSWVADFNAEQRR